jgi:hypothetical protein
MPLDRAIVAQNRGALENPYGAQPFRTCEKMTAGVRLALINRVAFPV